MSPRPRRGIAGRSSPINSELPTDWRGRPTPAAAVSIIAASSRGDEDDVLAAVPPALDALDRGEGAFVFWGDRCLGLIADRRMTDPAYGAAIREVWRAIALGPHNRHHAMMGLAFALGPDLEILEDIPVDRALEIVEGGCSDVAMHDPEPWLALRGAGPATESAP